MKNYKVHIAIINCLVLLSMFFAYQILSEYKTSWDFGTKEIREGNRFVSGFNLIAAYGIIGGLIIVSFITLITRNVNTSIIGLVISILLFFYTLFVAFVTTFSLFEAAPDLGFGYYLGMFAVLYLIVIQLINLVSETKNRKRKMKNHPGSTIDLLDDF